MILLSKFKELSQKLAYINGEAKYQRFENSINAKRNQNNIAPLVNRS